jgi:UPF0755 protein
MPYKRSPNPSFGCLLAVFTVCSIFCIVAGQILYTIPQQANEIFGQPSSRVSSIKRWLLAWQLWKNKNELTTPYVPGGSEQNFRVEMGEGVRSIAGRLQQQGLIAHAEAFEAYLVYRGLDVSLQAGDYTLSPAMTAISIAHAMQDATPTHVTFHVLAGWRLEEIAAALPTSGMNISPNDFLALARLKPEGYDFSASLPGSASAEGYLSPGVYEFPRQTPATEFISTLFHAFEANQPANLRQDFAIHGLSLHEGVILASIIEREAIQEDEMPTIASVFYNRLALGMNLAADPTVQYALGFNAAQQTWWTNPLSLADLEFASPYNTYHNPGLPPGPICNPGLSALKAAANPAETPYYFFRAACDGSGRHNFAATFDEHQANQCP